ncbi:unnamed protein product [Sphagnum jensenii]
MMISAEPKANQTEPSRIAAFKSRRIKAPSGEGEGAEAKQLTTNNHLSAICRGGRRRPILRSIANRR